MGGGHYSDSDYVSTMKTAAASPKGFFTHSSDIASGVIAAKTHEKLDPSIKNAVGKLVRESFDSPDHPESTPVAVLFDVTGSMSDVPKIFVQALGNLMKLLVSRGYLKDPQILFGAIGDATCDRAPIQMGQFESSNVMDSMLSLFYLEAGGGGQQTESYELGMYYMARHTDLHSLTKRNKKGYLFMFGDEMNYDRVKAREVKKFIGVDLEADIPFETILAELRQKFEVFWILPKYTNNYNNSKINNHCKSVYGQNFLKLEDPNDVCNLIATQIAIAEGVDIEDVEDDLKSLGASSKSIANVKNAIVVRNDSTVTRRKAAVKGTLAVKGKDRVERV